jgi:hypothetical protein
MKYIITGLHASGKREVIQDLKKTSSLRIGRTFNNISQNIEGLYNMDQIYYTNSEINSIFENRSYIFIKEITDYNIPFYTGLTKQEFDICDVFVLTPEQFIAIPSFPEEVCIIWLDNTTLQRKQRYNAQKMVYDFKVRENIEKEDSEEYINKLYKSPNAHLIYFENEEPTRVSAIIQAIAKHEDLLQLFESHYN